MLRIPEEVVSYSLYFPLLLKELNHKEEKKNNQENLSSLFNDNLGLNNESNMLFLIYV